VISTSNNVELLFHHRWYFPETKRLDAEKMLMSPENSNGAFLIRNCESQAGELSLSGTLTSFQSPNYFHMCSCETINVINVK